MNQLKINLIILVLFFWGCSQKQDKPVSLANPRTEKAFVSFRIGVPIWESDQRSNELMNLFDRYKGVTDEVTFFVATSQSPMPLEVFREQVHDLKAKMEQVRERGYRAGIDILTTIGHHEEDLDNSLKGSYTYMTNIDGQICRGSFCPNDENMRNYISSIYTFAVQANPDYIWIDDDIRFGHMPIGNGCFC